MTSILLMLALFFDVRGVVLDPSGRPVEGAQVTCGTASATTDSSGAFSVTGDQTCAATIKKDGFAATDLTLSASSDNRVNLRVATLTERVQVSATASPVTLEEAGISGTVFTQKDIEIRQNAPVQDILRDVSGVTVVQTGSGGGVTSVFVRGGEADSTLTLLDGIPLTDPGGELNYTNLTSSGLERVEMVRGPQSALYGAEAASGIIQLFSKQGDLGATIPHGALSYERGSFSTDRWTAGLGGGLGNRFDYYLTTDQTRSTGQFQNNVWRNTTGTANLGYRISNATSVRGIYRTYDSVTGTPGVTFYKAFDLDGRQYDRDHAASIRVDDVRGDHYSQRAYFAYHSKSSQNINPNTESYVRAALLRTADPIRTGTPPVRYLDRLVEPGTAGAVQRTITAFGGGFRSFTDRVSAAYNGTVTHKNGTFVFAYEYEKQAGDFSGSNVDRRNNGFSFYEQYNWNDRVFFSGGARIEHSSVYGGRFAPRGAVTFKLPTDTYLRLSLSRGIKEPSLLETNSPNPGFFGNPDLKPERTDSFEAGLTRTWMEGRIRTEIAYFRNFYSNLIQFRTVDPVTFAGTWFNADKAWARGVEINGSARITDLVTFNANYTRQSTRWVSAGPDQGQELARRPPNSGTMGLTLAPPAGRWSFLIGARFVGERRDVFNTFGINRMDSYKTAYFSATVQVQKHVALYLRVNNFNDELYQEVTGFQQWGRNATGGVRFTW